MGVLRNLRNNFLMIKFHTAENNIITKEHIKGDPSDPRIDLIYYSQNHSINQ